MTERESKQIWALGDPLSEWLRQKRLKTSLGLLINNERKRFCLVNVGSGPPWFWLSRIIFSKMRRFHNFFNTSEMIPFCLAVP